jgi:hypothetical protein
MERYLNRIGKTLQRLAASLAVFSVSSVSSDTSATAAAVPVLKKH